MQVGLAEVGEGRGRGRGLRLEHVVLQKSSLSHSPKEILSHNGVSVFHRFHNYMHIYKQMYLFLKKKKKVKADKTKKKKKKKKKKKNYTKIKRT